MGRGRCGSIPPTAGLAARSTRAPPFQDFQICMIRLIDTISEFAGRLAAWAFFAVGFFITYEVVMRYF